MRNSKSHTKTIKKKLNKCNHIFSAYNDLQYKCGELLDNRKEIVEIQANVKLIGCELGDNFTTDFYCLKSNGEYMVRECIYKDKLLKPLTIKMLDASRNFWLSKGISDWGLLIDS